MAKTKLTEAAAPEVAATSALQEQAGVSAEEQVQELTERVKVLEAENAELLETIAELQQQPATSDTSVLVHEGRKFRCEAERFRYKGHDYTAAELQQNPTLLAELVEKQVGFLSEIFA